MHAGDRQVAGRQCGRMLQDLFIALDGPDVFWVNHFEREGTAFMKVHQLRNAVAVGLSVPDTLVSNDPQEIRSFISQCGGVAIHKLLQVACWKIEDTGEVLGCYTSTITAAGLPRDDILRLCPGIFQPQIPKAFEVRVTCFGNYLMALRIDSQSDERARIDWRAGQWYVNMEPYELPPELAKGIRKLCRAMGLASASLDFIVTPQGEHVFLEANPRGQFLWMEERAGLPALDAMSSYLIAGHIDFEPESGSTPVTWSQFNDEWEHSLKNTVHKHVLTKENSTVVE